MTDGKNETALMVKPNDNALLNKTSQVSAMQRAEVGESECI